MERYTDENHACATLICTHLRLLATRLRALSPAQWDEVLTPTAPTPRFLATHILAWLICDRQHIEKPDARLHPRIPDAPTQTEALCRAIETEADRWERLISALTPEQMLESRAQFGDEEFVFNVRGLIVHTLRSTLYKHGQLMFIFYALGLDGAEKYSAPLPNDYYAPVPPNGS